MAATAAATMANGRGRRASTLGARPPGRTLPEWGARVWPSERVRWR